jgi:hypothetical protein
MRTRNAQAPMGSPPTVASAAVAGMARLPPRLLQPVEPVVGGKEPVHQRLKGGSRSSGRLKWNWQAVA